MMAIHLQQDAVKAFINDLTPGQIRTALELYMLRSSPLEELIEVSKSLFELMKDAALDNESRSAVEELDKQFRFWVSLC